MKIGELSKLTSHISKLLEGNSSEPWNDQVTEYQLEQSLLNIEKLTQLAVTLTPSLRKQLTTLT
jgi:hypothetical protein